eukprot:g29657.t1
MPPPVAPSKELEDHFAKRSLYKQDLKPDMLKREPQANMLPPEQLKLIHNSIFLGITQNTLVEVDRMLPDCQDREIKIVAIEDAVSNWPWGFFQSGLQIGAERWVVRKCGQQREFRVNVYRDTSSDSFYSTVFPWPLDLYGLTMFVGYKLSVLKRKFVGG